MTKHIPGPWAVRWPDSDPFVTSLKQDILIAAAPDMLEALQNLENDAGQIPDSA